MKWLIVTALLATTTVAYAHPAHRRVHRAPSVVQDDVSDPYAMTTDVLSAAGDGNLPLLKKLLRRGAIINTIGENGLSPLIVAVLGAHVEMVRFLLAHGAYVDSADNGDNTSLDYAEDHEKLDTDPVQRAKFRRIIAVLIKAGAGAQDRAILKAAGDGDTARLQTLIAHNARVVFPLGNPLILAASGGHVGAVRVLLKTHERSLFYDPDHNNPTALDDAEIREKRATDPALRAKYAEIIALLRKAGALEANQRSVLAAIGEDDVARLEQLFAQGATANFVDDERRTPLMCAAENAQVAAVRFLLAHGASVNSRDIWGRTSLGYAAEDGQAEAARLLLAHGADVNSKDHSGETSLDLAERFAKDAEPVQRAKYATVITILKKAGGKTGTQLVQHPQTHVKSTP